MIFYVGTYTRSGGPGIAICSLDHDRISVLDSVFAVDPGYIILSNDQKKLFAVSKDEMTAGIAGSYLLFERTETGLQRVAQYGTGDSGPSHLCLSPDQRFLYTANYASGSISVFPLDPPGKQIQLIRHQGHGTHETRQTTAHVHHVSFIPETRILLAVDLGMDALVLYQQDAVSGQLTAIKTFYTPPGWGPRHIAYHPSGLIYLAHELANIVSVLSYERGQLAIIQSVSTLPDQWQKENTAAAIRVTEDAVWVSNRGHDSLARFPLHTGGLLGTADFFTSGGQLPRDFAWIGHDRVLVANQGGSIALLDWNHATRNMSIMETADLPGAICVCPVRST